MLTGFQGSTRGNRSQESRLQACAPRFSAARPVPGGLRRRIEAVSPARNRGTKKHLLFTPEAFTFR